MATAESTEALPPERREALRANVARVRERMNRAAEQAGRDPATVRLVAVTKSATVAETQAIVDLGCTLLGESRVQSAAEKVPLVRGDVTWHLIGNLQRNKARKALQLVETIQSLDSERLAATLQRLAGEMERRVPVFVEVNVSGEAHKHGLPPDEVEPLLVALRGLDRLDVRGLMTMAPYTADEAEIHRCFAGLRQLRDQLATHGFPLPELSMGMTNDFEQAIAEGATVVRIGSALFA